MDFGPSITEQIYVELRDDLVSCRIRPGERLRTNELGQRFNASLSAVREALVRLTAEGLAVADPRRGFRAAPISSEDLMALTEAAAGIEALCIQTSLTSGDARWEQGLRAACARVEQTPLEAAGNPGRVSAAFTLAHIGFHDALVSACLNPWLLRLRATLEAQARRYRQICLPMEPARLHDTGYAQILTAALERDVALTTELVRTRFMTNAERFAKVLQTEGEDTRFWADGAERQAAAG